MNFKLINNWMFPDFESKLCAVNSEGKSVYSGLEHVEKALSHVKEFGLALDVGANVGLISVPLTKSFKKVISIECIPDTYECLLYNLKNNSYNSFEAFNFALSDTLGNIEVAIPQHNGLIASSGWASISPERKKSFQEKILLNIECKTIDSLNLDRLDFLKIDVEQAEMMVIRGGLYTIKKFQPVIEFENKRGENNSVVSLLESLGYKTIPGRKRKSSEAIMIPT